MSTNPDRLPPELEIRLALYRLRLARVKALKALAEATLAMQAARDERNQRFLTEMMQRHERLDA